MYYVKFYNKNYVFLKRINFLTDLTFTKSMDNNGPASFKMPILDERIEDYDLDKYQNIIEIYRNDVIQYIGILEGTPLDNEYVTFNCVNYIQRLEKRIVASKSFVATDGGQAAFTLLTDTNTTEDTLITAGNENITTTVDETITYTTVLAAIKKLQETVSGQLFLNTDYSLDLLSLVGEDKTSTVKFIYDYLNPVRNTIKEDWQILRDGKELFNQIIGTTSGGGGLTSTKTDTTSQGSYGLQQKAVAFGEADNQGTLDDKTDEYLAQNKDVKIVPVISPDNSKIVYTTYDIGDRVTVKINKGRADLENTYQITNIVVNVTGENEEVVNISLSDYTLNNRPPRLPSKIFDEMFERIEILEIDFNS